ncbi:hypothetical protein ACFYWY_38065 [Streptomyces sp. NPDC002870]|uniref:hypothetical protein n=1 Tax=Streptomyces sp. NPDC002870 TaxID=3364666 RepID=UPI0036917BE4
MGADGTTRHRLHRLLHLQAAHMNFSNDRTAHRIALGRLLNEIPGSDEFLFWHIIETAGYLRPAKNVMVVEPYGDGSTVRRLRQGIDHLTREAGDEAVVEDLCALLSDLFGDPETALVAFLDRYMADIGHTQWRADVWLADLGIALRDLSAPDELLALRRKWIKPSARSVQLSSHDTTGLRNAQSG